jgi:hypothetical protein
MVQLANQVDRDVMALYKQVPNWVGTPGQTINSFADFALGPQRSTNTRFRRTAARRFCRRSDHWGLLGSQTALYIQDAAKGAYRNGSLGMIGGVDTYMSQKVPTHTVGFGRDRHGQPGDHDLDHRLHRRQEHDAADDHGCGVTLNAGDVFTIAGRECGQPGDEGRSGHPQAVHGHFLLARTRRCSRRR